MIDHNIESFVFSGLESIEKRFQEVEILLKFAEENQMHDKIYPYFCRAAHIILVAHFEGIVKDICKDVINDINYNNSFETVPKKIFNTYCNHFLIKGSKGYDEKKHQTIRGRLGEAFGKSKANLKVDPFIEEENKNLAPAIIETILGRFGLSHFFLSLKNSDLDVVFEDSKTETNKLKNVLLKHITGNVREYPYKVTKDIYNPDKTILSVTKKQKTLWEDFIDDILMKRHRIVHGHDLNNLYDHENLYNAKIKIEILIYVIIINLCSISNPVNIEPIAVGITPMEK